MGLDTAPFKSLYPALEAMMKARHRIVHEADLTPGEDPACPTWSVANEFLLAFWLLAVLTFYSQLSVSIDPADELQRWYLARLTGALARAREVGNRLREMTPVPKESLPLAIDGLTTA